MTSINYKRGMMKPSLENIIYIVLSIIMAVCLAGFLYMDKSENIRESKELNKINQQVYEEEREHRAAQKLKEAEDSFYQKLADGFKVNILVVGDSIGAGAGT